MDFDEEQLLEKITDADAILVGAGSGMSVAAGLDFWYRNDENVLEQMGDFVEKYGFNGMFNGFYTRYPDQETRWAFLAKLCSIMFNTPATKPVYDNLKKILSGKKFHIMTTNADEMFNRYFDDDKISAIQGDWGFFQSSNTLTDQNLYDSIPYMKKIKNNINNMQIPTELIPRSKVNGAILEPSVRSQIFLEGDRYKAEYDKINTFIKDNQEKKLLLLELGVGRMTPMFIQQPFWNLTYNLPKASYVNINPKDAMTHPKIEDKSLVIHEDINTVFADIVKNLQVSK